LTDVLLLKTYEYNADFTRWVTPSGRPGTVVDTATFCGRCGTASTDEEDNYCRKCGSALTQPPLDSTSDAPIESDTLTALVEPTLDRFPAPPPVWRLTVVQVTSFIVLSFQKTRTVTGSLAECEALYSKVQSHNQAVGWWSPFGIFWNPSALSRNRKAISALRALSASGAVAAGWHPDPSGRQAKRYWDGLRWTDQVSDFASDPASTLTRVTVPEEPEVAQVEFVQRLHALKGVGALTNDEYENEKNYVLGGHLGRAVQGWYPDPRDQSIERFYTGRRWSFQSRGIRKARRALPLQLAAADLARAAQLERLSGAAKSGALTSEEFGRQKRLLFEARVVLPPPR
jgi:hypothetical protein